MIKEIRQAIIDEITNNAQTIQAVYRTKSTFAGFPAVVVLPSDSDSDFGTTQDDRYTFVFRVKIYYPITAESEQDTVEEALEDALDELIGIFKVRNVLAGACDWVMPVPFTWGEETVGEGVYRTASITLKCVKYIDN
jgi:hypothetical protein